MPLLLGCLTNLRTIPIDQWRYIQMASSNFHQTILTATLAPRLKVFVTGCCASLRHPLKAIKRDSPFTISRFEMSQYTNTKWVHVAHWYVFSSLPSDTAHKVCSDLLQWGMPYQQLTTKSENESLATFGSCIILHSHFSKGSLGSFSRYVYSHFCFKFAGRFLTRQKGCAMRGP